MSPTPRALLLRRYSYKSSSSSPLRCGAESHWSKVKTTNRYRLTQVQGTPNNGCSLPLQQQEPAAAAPPREELELLQKNRDLEDQIKQLKDQVAELQHKNEQLTEECKDTRKWANNTIQELRGNVRVLVRARPAQQQDVALSFRSDGARLTLNGDGQGRSFEFDRVFRPSSTQDDVYNEVSGLVQSAIDGYHGSVFVYGLEKPTRCSEVVLDRFAD
ncbi:P-loop containing nucleoside triphosphate hydrolase [Phytophthora cinnamomi]|uniref:P-loop containing nucleoside triphosphate hydrolase n=1 Tax=Phytophthora cinnamomi TaxID=4785 RepID=UPI003559958E|nr:P-loop containing nucleoside triphosphate hydrolase [Phytophthora cinnamomi]